MSYTFTADVSDAQTSTKEEPCLCAQGAECFGDAFQNSVEPHRAELAAEAWDKCLHCKGTGVESVENDDAPSLNLGNDNAVSLLGALGLTVDCWGEIALPEARRAVMRARARKSLSVYTRATEIVYGAPRADENGAIELRPIRSHGFGLTEDGLRDRIERFASFVEASASRGATTITWG